MSDSLNKRALLQLGWTPALITAILGKPDETVHHKHGMKRWVEHLYTRIHVDQAAKDPRFTAAIEKRKTREQQALRRTREIPQRFVSWQAALPEACAGMFTLNRYAKHQTCSPLHKVEIYALKNEFVAALYQHGYATAAWIHQLVQEAKACHYCDGGGDCDRCGGSGEYLPARTLEFWCFRFLVQGKTYCWHQPRRLVQFTPVETVPPQEWEGLAIQEKALCLPKRKFAAVKDLLRWVIDRANAPVEEAPAAVETTEPENHPFARLSTPSEQQSLFQS